MNANHLLLVVLTPLLVANCVMWLIVAHQPVIAGLWLASIYPCWRWLPND